MFFDGIPWVGVPSGVAKCGCGKDEVSSEDGIGGGVAIAEYPEIDSIGASRSCAKAMRRSAKVTRRGKISDSRITFGHDEKTKPK